MKRSLLLYGVVLTAIPLMVHATDFPLEFKTLTAHEAMTFPGGSPIYGSFETAKPAGITKEPPAISHHPIYGELSSYPRNLLFRLDESKGDRNGYDRLIVDMKQNGDLTDDPVVQRTAPAGESAATMPETGIFGPIPAPADKMVGAARPIYFAKLMLYNQIAVVGENQPNSIIGQLELSPGWYLEGSVDIDGVKRKVAIVDGNCNSRLGDANEAITAQSGGERMLYFQGGDYMLMKSGNFGSFVQSAGPVESMPFGQMLYLGTKPCKASVSPDWKSLKIEPWTGPLAELDLQPHGEQVSEIQLAWERAPDQWQLCRASVTNGKVMMPPGNYRLYSCQLSVKTSKGETLTVTGMKRGLSQPVEAKAGAVTPFKVGAPLDVKVTAERDTSPAGVSGLLGGLFSSRSSGQPVQQLITATILGAGGEQYSSFVLQGRGLSSQPPKPTFVITGTDGKKVDSGSMEFG